MAEHINSRGPPIIQNGSTMTIPPAMIGDMIREPADWADKIMRGGFVVLWHGDAIRSELAEALMLLEKQRDPNLRYAGIVTWTGEKLWGSIGASRANVESAMIQVVGLVQIIPCRHCLQRDGPWAHCVVAPGKTHCGNCHWGGNGFRCSFGPSQRMPPRRTRRPISNAQAPDPAYRQRLATLRANMVVIEGYMRQVWDHVTTLTEICYLMLSSDPVERSQVRQLLAELTVLNRRLREAQNAYQDLVNSYQDLVETLLAVIETL